MWNIFKQVWLISIERAKARKAVRVLVKQSWSVEFVLYLLKKSVALNGTSYSITLKNPDGQMLILNADYVKRDEKFSQIERDLDVRDENLQLQAMLDAAEAHGVL